LKKEAERKVRDEKIKSLKIKYEEYDTGKIGADDLKIFINQVKNIIFLKFRN
jgi:hypothetical protein